jgi:hypothetical protein
VRDIRRDGWMKRLGVMAVLAMNCVVGVTQDLRPERVVKGSTITSHRDPAMRIELPHQAQYLGGDRWVLYAVADCEIHVFVEADAEKQVRRMYWIQFEQFIPNRPELQHNYKPEELTKFAGMEMYVRARFGKSDEVAKEGSDLEHVQALVRAKGYSMPPEMMNVRLVRLLDPQRRQELMIIYAETLEPTGVTVDDLMPGGKATDKWSGIQKSLIERAERQIRFMPEL